MITGGTGFLGSYLTRHLVHEKGITGKNLILFDRYPNKDRIADVLEQVILITGDITEPTELAAAMNTHEVDQVYHLAAILGDPTSTQVVSYMKVMCDGTLNVFETARVMGVKRVVYASSVAVYGRASFRGKKSGDELDEDDPPSPGTFYGMCKLYAENLAALYSRRFGLETVGLRPTPCLEWDGVRGVRTQAACYRHRTFTTWFSRSWRPWASRCRCPRTIQNRTGFTQLTRPKPGTVR